MTDFTATRKQIDKLCAEVEVQTGEKAYWFRLDESGELVGGISKFVAPVREQVVSALGLDKKTAAGVIRISFSPDNTEADVDALCRALKSHRDSRFPML